MRNLAPVKLLVRLSMLAWESLLFHVFAALPKTLEILPNFTQHFETNLSYEMNQTKQYFDDTETIPELFAILFVGCLVSGTLLLSPLLLILSVFFFILSALSENKKEASNEVVDTTSDNNEGDISESSGDNTTSLPQDLGKYDAGFVYEKDGHYIVVIERISVSSVLGAYYKVDENGILQKEVEKEYTTTKLGTWRKLLSDERNHVHSILNRPFKPFVSQIATRNKEAREAVATKKTESKMDQYFNEEYLNYKKWEAGTIGANKSNAIEIANEFERLTALTFKKLGYEVEQNGTQGNRANGRSGSGDGGIDLTVKKDGKVVAIVSCKCYGSSKKITVVEPRAVLGLANTKDFRGATPIIVSVHDHSYTADAIEFVEHEGTIIITNLYTLMTRVKSGKGLDIETEKGFIKP